MITRYPFAPEGAEVWVGAATTVTTVFVLVGRSDSLGGLLLGFTTTAYHLDPTGNRKEKVRRSWPVA
jgi:hypothetical protein